MQRPNQSLFFKEELSKEVTLLEEYKECFTLYYNHTMEWLKDPSKNTDNSFTDKYDKAQNKVRSLYMTITDRNYPCPHKHMCVYMDTCRYKHSDEDIITHNKKLCEYNDNDYVRCIESYFGTIDTVNKCLDFPTVLLEIIHDYISMPDYYTYIARDSHVSNICVVCKKKQITDAVNARNNYFLLTNGKIVIGND
jgi:hypothetical protein